SVIFLFSSRRRHTRCYRDWSSDVCSSDLVDLSGLTADQKKEALHRLNAESCTCGCKLTLAECRINDSSCPVSKGAANDVVMRVRAGQPEPDQPPATPPQPPSPKT